MPPPLGVRCALFWWWFCDVWVVLVALMELIGLFVGFASEPASDARQRRPPATPASDARQRATRSHATRLETSGRCPMSLPHAPCKNHSTPRSYIPRNATKTYFLLCQTVLPRYLGISPSCGIISHKNVKKKQRTKNRPSNEKFWEIFGARRCVWSDVRRGWQAQAPLAVTFRFHVPVGDWNARAALSGDTSRVKIGFHWACRLITSLRSGLDVDRESQIITHTGRAEWRRSRTQGRGYNHGNSEHSIGGWEAPSVPVLGHQERKRDRREARPWFLGSSSDLWQQENGLSDCRVIMWRVVVAMEQRDPRLEPKSPP